MYVMNKDATTDLPIALVLAQRWSPRAFLDKAITEKDMNLILEAGRWAPSSNNFQPWSVIWGIAGTETYDRILQCLDTFNQSWAVNAKALMIAAFNQKMPNSDKTNFHALHDLGLFTANMTYQAQHLGIGVHQMAGVLHEKAKEEFQFPANYHVATAIAFGYYGGNADQLEGGLKEAEQDPTRKRKKREEFAFNGNYGSK